MSSVKSLLTPLKKSGETARYRLPDSVTPIAYRLTIEPDLDKLNYTGTVEIDIDVRKPTREVVLNAVDLQITDASLNGIPAKLGDFTLFSAEERLTLLLCRLLPKGRAKLAFRFTGVISEKMRGFYRSSYIAADGSSKRWLATTQFEPNSARRAFPCFDQPELKATFEVSIVVPEGRTAISNMPIMRRDGRHVTFAPTPIMSTYLLMFAVGEFKYIEAKTKDDLPVRVYATPGQCVRLGEFSLETAVRGLEWFDNYFGIPYRQSVPKCDLVAIPDIEAGAMENWGAITFRETAIFVHPGASSILQKRRVAEVVLHELAHQWFGNLVSPKWWSYLWLKESFATFMAYKAMDALFPEWRVWEKYVAAITSAGISLDSLRSSHPVEVQVGDPSEIDQIYDAIAYNKGGSVLRMLEQAIGDVHFRQGIALYLRRHQYASATSNDFWNAIGEASHMSVRSMMEGWTQREGFPVLIANHAGHRLKLVQERFLLGRNPAKPGKDRALWHVPVTITDTEGLTTTTTLTKRAMHIPAPDGIFKLNAAQSGFYLSHYDNAGWRDLTATLASFSALDRYGLQADAYLLMRAGYLSVGTYLQLSQGFRNEDNHHVWSGLTSGLGELADIFVGDEQVPRLEVLARDLLHSIVEKVGWEEHQGELPEQQLLRVTVLSAAIRFGEPATVEEVHRKFEAARENLASVPPNLQGLVFNGAARHGNDEVLEQLIKLYEKENLPETKVRLLRAMGAFRREEPLRDAVAYTLGSGKGARTRRRLRLHWHSHRHAAVRMEADQRKLEDDRRALWKVADAWNDHFSRGRENSIRSACEGH